MKALALALALLAAPAAAQALRPSDQARLDDFDATVAFALLGAFAEGPPGDVAVLASALRGQPTVADPAGDWSCRTLKLGGLLPLTAYPAFRCRVTEVSPGTWHLEKLTGSQRLDGTIRAEEGRNLYTGVGFVDGGPAGTYADMPEADEAVEPGQTFPQVGLFEIAAPDQARLFLPRPFFESALDILWLYR